MLHFHHMIFTGVTLIYFLQVVSNCVANCALQNLSLLCLSFPLSHSPHSYPLHLHSPVPPSLSLTLPTLIPSIFTPLYLLPSSHPSSFLLHCQHACLGSDETDDCGMTCLMWAAYNNSPEVVKVLLDRGAEVEEKDVDGLTALHWWVGTGWRQRLHWLEQLCSVSSLWESQDIGTRFTEWMFLQF